MPFKARTMSCFSKILWVLLTGLLFLQPLGFVFAQTVSTCIDSGDGGDLITADAANPLDVGTIAPVVSVNPYAGWLPDCGNSQFISDQADGKVTPITSVGTNQIVITRTLNLTAAQLAAATFNITAKADDAITVIVNGNTANPALSCGGAQSPCFEHGCITASGPNSAFQNQFVAGANTITIVIQDLYGDHIAGDYELCATYPAVIPTATNTATATATSTCTNTPTATATNATNTNASPTNTPVSTWTPTATAGPEVFQICKNVFNIKKDINVCIVVGTNQYPGRLALRIYNSAGEHIRTLLDETLTQPLSPLTVNWDGKNKFGQEVDSGVYVLYLEKPLGRELGRLVVIH